tara:strand:+ start:368 stop:850 length:483 start_codon:yes stop_codon:yes gene_type:complete
MNFKKIFKENILFIAVLLTIFFLDRYAKITAINILENKKNIYINDYLNLDLVFNTGIGFGLLSFNENFYYNLVTILILIVIIIIGFFTFKSEKKEKLFFTFILGGAIGNVYDRITYKAVPDFIDLHIGNFHWFSFNIADIFITLGIIFMILTEFTVKEKK